MNELKEIDERIKVINDIRPFEGVYLRQINQFFKIETAYSSNAIEGNTHTLEETKVILEDGITIGGRPLKEFHEIEGYGKAYDYMFSLIKQREITQKDILRCHNLFSANIPNFIGSGEYRNIEVIISASAKKLPKAKDVPAEMEKYAQWLDKNRNALHPVMFAAEAHRRLVNIHPFTDGNGRVSRLVMNTFLYQDKLFPVSIPLIKRSDYYRVLEKNDPEEFGNFIAKIELQTIKDLMRHLHLEFAGAKS
ncbi:MAG: Fic family protein [Helicobacteraceae bacterium]|jgi:Fic family protein|nr:Fic family protein [Helicobacteraceae bacterium]